MTLVSAALAAVATTVVFAVVCGAFLKTLGESTGYGPQWWREQIKSPEECSHGLDGYDRVLGPPVQFGRNGLRMVGSCYDCGAAANVGWVWRRPDKGRALLAFYAQHPPANSERLGELTEALRARSERK